MIAQDGAQWAEPAIAAPAPSITGHAARPRPGWGVTSAISHCLTVGWGSGCCRHLSVVICGHVDSGKSTTTGRLIFELGGIPERELEKLKVC